MEHELAKQLKEAGFPQNEEELTCKCGYTNCEIHDYERVYIPILSELIEACGKGNVFELFEESDSWKAVVNYPKIEFERGKTPEEAVAMLWLKLNEPKPGSASGGGAVYNRPMKNYKQLAEEFIKEQTFHPTGS